MPISACLAALVMASTPPALTFIDMVVGTGEPAGKGDRVTLSYVGSLTTGKEFDNTKDRAPIAVTLGAEEVIPGLDRGLLGVRTGTRRILSIPAELGFGDQEVGLVPPKSQLIFDLRVLRIDRKGATPKLDIEEIAPGEGPEVKAGDTVTMHYRGTFLDGREFDSSYKSGKPFDFKVGSGMVIKGFDQGATGMKKGGKRKITVPPELGYGARGAGGVIPPNSTLIFEIEVVAIK